MFPRRIVTQKGRVVYDRKPTPFKYRDIHRIARALEPVFWLGEPRETLFAYRTIAILYGKLAYGSWPGNWLNDLIGRRAETPTFDEGVGLISGLLEWLQSRQADTSFDIKGFPFVRPLPTEEELQAIRAEAEAAPMILLDDLWKSVDRYLLNLFLLLGDRYGKD